MEKMQTLLDKEALCAKIREIYPDIGECGIDVVVAYDEGQTSWTVHLKRGEKELRTFISDEDAELCMKGVQCVSLGIEINQLKDSIDRMPAGNR